MEDKICTEDCGCTQRPDNICDGSCPSGHENRNN